MFLAGGRRLPSLNFRDGNQGENFWSVSEKGKERKRNKEIRKVGERIELPPVKTSNCYCISPNNKEYDL